ncbi:YezD family protein [Candidatus Formimonas warabiya]|uniref:YezD family protein n=1 Tax=Formimonas warabiya TaxID=1761012 RepID=UPI0011D0A618|nr:YezD family protein [Candidatus Formimonas warabiya]
MAEPKENIKKTNHTVSEEDFKKIFEIVKGVGYGSITLIIHEGKIVQIEKNIKMRLT